MKNNKAFSLTELLTTVGIVGTLSVVGIKSYQKQTNQAKTAEAKKSLAYVYSAERNFYNNWGGYHESLIAIGAAPTGVYNYDVGFGKSATLSSNYGSLASYPKVNNKDVLNVRQCTNFRQICDHECLNTLKTLVGSSHQQYFETGGSYYAKANCQVNVVSTVLLKNYVSSAGAVQNSFKALAITKLKSTDVWSVDQLSVFRHETDGTQ